MNRRELDKQLVKLYFFGKFICSNISHVDTLLSQTEKYSRMLSGKINDFANSHGSESSLQLNQNCEQVLNGKGEENLSDSVSYHPTDSETSDDEAYMRKEMAYDRENNFDYVAEVRDLQDDASIPFMEFS